MYCPKCSQQQSSDEMRFCPRCGFALAGVAMLMENDGVIPQVAGGPRQTVPTSRKKVMTESGIFTAIAWAVLIVATLWFDAGGPFESLAKIAAVLFFFLGLIGLLRFLYGFLFVKDTVDQPAQNAFYNVTAQGGRLEASKRAALPGQRDFSVSDYPRRGHIKEMVQPPSVTKNTTRLLDETPTNRSD